MNDYGNYNHDYYQTIQNTLLAGQYLHKSRFENLSATNCYSRYTSPLSALVMASPWYRQYCPTIATTIAHCCKSLGALNSLQNLRLVT
jgi:hypothetical protein